MLYSTREALAGIGTLAVKSWCIEHQLLQKDGASSRLNMVGPEDVVGLGTLVAGRRMMRAFDFHCKEAYLLKRRTFDLQNKEAELLERRTFDLQNKEAELLEWRTFDFQNEGAKLLEQRTFDLQSKARELLDGDLPPCAL